ncbi:hypothetical protein Daus18300_004042 [Diaporthe australafricana]|uniref:Uncharacterized protein n=1 Tax=Diaporthe australafricana TaxID=127596 RepID=A0ABR3XC03_9PEZI
MDPNVNKAVSDWNIAGVGSEDIQVPVINPSDTVALCERGSAASSLPSGLCVAEIDFGPVNLSKESSSIFDRFPEAFEAKLDEDGEAIGPDLLGEPNDNLLVFGQLPKSLAIDPARLRYSWMIQNPGQMPESVPAPSGEVRSDIPFPRRINPPPNDEFPTNVEGERNMEAQFKSGLLRPSEYLFRAAGFSCIMELNSQGLLHPTHFAAIIGRLFNGEARFLDVFNDFFVPRGLSIVPTTRVGVTFDSLLQLTHHLDSHPAHANNPQFKILVKLLHKLVIKRVIGTHHMDELVGKLVMSRSRRELRPAECPSPNAMLGCPKLSPLFLCRIGDWWPFDNISWQQADVCNLYSMSKAGAAKAADCIDPRLLTYRGIYRAWA